MEEQIAFALKQAGTGMPMSKVHPNDRQIETTRASLQTGHIVIYLAG